MYHIFRYDLTFSLLTLLSCGNRVGRIHGRVNPDAVNMPFAPAVCHIVRRAICWDSFCAEPLSIWVPRLCVRWGVPSEGGVTWEPATLLFRPTACSISSTMLLKSYIFGKQMICPLFACIISQNIFLLYFHVDNISCFVLYYSSWLSPFLLIWLW